MISQQHDNDDQLMAELEKTPFRKSLEANESITETVEKEQKEDALTRHTVKLDQLGLLNRPFLYEKWKEYSTLEEAYILQELLQGGASGVVILASPRNNQAKQVIMKIYFGNNEKQKDAAAEIDTLTSIKSVVGEYGHPNIVDIVDYFYWHPLVMDHIPKELQSEKWFSAGIKYRVMVTQKVAGDDLLHFIENHWNLKKSAPNPLLVRDIMLKTLRGLTMVHGLGFAHRDIKPENIIVNEFDYQCVLIDFGFACHRLFDFYPKDMLSCRDRCSIGTALYISPETMLYQEQNKKDSRVEQWMASDIWSLGLVLTVFVLGTFPHATAKSILEVGRNLQSYKEPYPVLYGQDALVNNMLRQMLDKNWKKRPTAHALVQMLEGDMQSMIAPVQEDVVKQNADGKYRNQVISKPSEKLLLEK